MLGGGLSDINRRLMGEFFIEKFEGNMIAARISQECRWAAKFSLNNDAYCSKVSKTFVAGRTTMQPATK